MERADCIGKALHLMCAKNSMERHLQIRSRICDRDLVILREAIEQHHSAVEHLVPGLTARVEEFNGTMFFPYLKQRRRRVFLSEQSC